MNGPSSSLVDPLEATYSGAVFDVLREMGLPNQAMPSTIRPLDPRMKSADPVYTASGRVVRDPEDLRVDRVEELINAESLVRKAILSGWMQEKRI
jgi:hypothetical protein